MSEGLVVSPVRIAAAKVLVKRARARGVPVDPEIQAIADTRPAPLRRNAEVETHAD